MNPLTHCCTTHTHTHTTGAADNFGLLTAGALALSSIVLFAVHMNMLECGSTCSWSSGRPKCVMSAIFPCSKCPNLSMTAANVSL